MPKNNESRSLLCRYREWRADRRRFPVTWLTYGRRVRDDVETLYKSKGGPEFFNDKYISALTESVEQLEARELKLFAYQVPITIFMILAFVANNNDIAITIFGISLKDTPGVRELLVFVASTMSMALVFVQQSKHLRVIIIEKLTELRTDRDFIDFAKLASKSGYDLRVYIAKQFNKWVFPTFPTKFANGVVWLLLAACGLAAIVFLWVLSIYFAFQIIQAPTLGWLSYAAISYGIAVQSSLLLWAIIMQVPLPYRDRQKLKRLAELQHTDRAAYEALWKELYGEK